MTGTFPRKLFFVCFIIICNFPIQFSFADTISASADAARQAEDMQRRTQQELLHQLEMDRKASQKSTQLTLPSPVYPKVAESSKCWPINKIKLKGIHLLAVTKANLEKKYSGRCISAKDIQNLMSELTAKYINKGFVTARVYLPAQDLTQGTLQLLIIEGKVTDIHQDEGDGVVYLGNILPDAKGQPFNLRDLEQAIEQLNRLASNNASFTLEPGEYAGETIINLHNNPSKRWHVSTSYDNRGSDSTGQNQIGTSLALDNPLGINDYLSVTHRRSQHYSDSYKGSSSTSVVYIAPYGYSTFTLLGAHSIYDSPLYAPSGMTLNTRGDTKQLSLLWDYVVYRNQSDRLTLSGQVSGKETKSYLQDVLLDVSSRRLSILDLDVSYNTNIYGGLANVDVGFSKGLSLWGALKDDTSLSKDMPKAQFHKLRLSGGYFKQFMMGQQLFSISHQLSAQYALDRLYGSEQMSIGGLYTVRGLKNDSLAGDHGYYLRNDLSWYYPTQLLGYRFTVKPYVGLDFGYVSSVDTSADSGAMTGSAVGFAIFGNHFSFDCFYSHILNTPNAIEQQGGVTYFTMSANF